MGLRPQAIIVADFDADGRPDVAVTSLYTNVVTILLGTGDGNLGAAVSFPTGVSAAGLIAVDFDADGKLDLAVAGSTSLAT